MKFHCCWNRRMPKVFKFTNFSYSPIWVMAHPSSSFSFTNWCKILTHLSNFCRVQMRICANTLKRFPNADEEALKDKIPLVTFLIISHFWIPHPGQYGVINHSVIHLFLLLIKAFLLFLDLLNSTFQMSR